MNVWTFLYWLGVLAGVYVTTAVAFLLLVRIPKEADGTLVLDAKSWHFRVAYPLMEYASDSRKSRKFYNGIGLCRYFYSFFWGLFLKWPLMITLQVIGYSIFTVPLLLCGFYPKTDFAGWEREDNLLGLFGLTVGEIKFRGKSIIPGLVIVPAVILLFTLYDPGFIAKVIGLAWPIIQWVLIVVSVIAIIFGLVILKDWLFDAPLEVKEGEEVGRVGLVRERIRAAKENLCPVAKVKY